MSMLMRLCRPGVAPLLLLVLICAGCLAPPVKTPMPPGVAIALVTTGVQPLSPVAVTPDESLIALVRRDGLYLYPLADSGEKRLSADRPIALAFSPQGTELVAAFLAADGERSLIRRYDARSAALLAEISFPGRCDALLNRDGEWLIFVTTMEVFRFGGNLSSRLLRWDGMHVPAESLLKNMTLFHTHLAEKGDLSATLRPQLSPHGDEILFLRLQDPPAFDPYLSVVLRHLETGSERLVAKLPRLRGAATYLDGGELVAYGDGINLVKIVEPWSETEHQRLSRPGQELAAPAVGEILWVDETLLGRDGQVLMNFAGQVQPVSFLADGRMLLRDKERLWLLSGLSRVTSGSLLPDSEQLRQLRKWRAEGLIDVREYAERVNE